LLLLLVVAAVAKSMLLDLKTVISLCLLVIYHFQHGFWSWGAKPVFNRNKFHLLHTVVGCSLLLLLLLVVAAVAKSMLLDLKTVISLCLLAIFQHGFRSWGAKPVFNRNKFHLLHTVVACCCCHQVGITRHLAIRLRWVVMVISS